MYRAAFFLIAACAFAQDQRPNGLYATFQTSMGTFTARLYEKEVPNTVKTFVGLATGTQPTRSPKTGKAQKVPFFDGITFHRVVPGEMIQAGDPTGTGRFNCGFTIQDEFLPGLRFDMSGKLAMANTGEPNSGGCQFFITVGPMAVWNGKYTIFGTVVEGMNVVEKINHTPVQGDKPKDPVKLVTVAIERVGPEPGKKHK